MASIKDVERVADDLESLVGELRQELKNGADFGKLVSIADQISEHADNAAQTFNNVNDALMSRLDEITGGKKSSSSGSSKSHASSSSSSPS
jgi:ABC-type transporter Mla subunit MlaD